jgi:hypothetical protein
VWESCVAVLKVRCLGVVKRSVSTAMLRASIGAGVMSLEVTGTLDSLWFRLELAELNYGF